MLPQHAVLDPASACTVQHVEIYHLHSINMHVRPSVYQFLCAGGGVTETDETHSLPLRVNEGDTDMCRYITSNVQGG